MLASKNYLDQLQDTHIERININLFKKFKEDTKKQLKRIKKKELNENKHLTPVIPALRDTEAGVLL